VPNEPTRLLKEGLDFALEQQLVLERNELAQLDQLLFIALQISLLFQLLVLPQVAVKEPKHTRENAPLQLLQWRTEQQQKACQECKRTQLRSTLIML